MLIKSSSNNNPIIISRENNNKMPRIRFYSFLLGLIALAHAVWLINMVIENYQGETVYDKILEYTQPPQIEPSLLPSVHLVFTSSASYTLGLLALVNSTLTTASPSTLPRLKFHIVSSDKLEAKTISTMLKKRFGKRVEGKIRTYGLNEVGDERLEGVKVWAGYRASSLSQPIVFARYLIPSMLPNDVTRVIYLDQDVLVKKDLEELWDIDMDGFPIAAARLCRPTALWRKQFVMNKEPLLTGAFDHDTCSLNNGVLVYDLEAWRAASHSYTDELFKWTKLNSEDKLYSLGSQPPFNLVFYRNYKILDDRWNLMDISGLREETEYGHGMPSTRTREDVNAAAIIHWNGVLKPWDCNGQGHYSEIWTAYFPDFRNHLPLDHIEPDYCSNIVITDISAPPSFEQFTVVIVSFARVDTLLKIAKHLQRSLYIKEIVIAWNNLDKPCPEALVALPWVKCYPQVANLVHNRFLIWPNITTDAVLHYDDDLVAPLEDLEAAFHIWQSHRDQVLGFEPRTIICDGDEARRLRKESREKKLRDAEEFGSIPVLGGSPSAGVLEEENYDDDDEAGRKETGCQYRFKLTRGSYNVVIGKLFMVGKNYMQAYFDNGPVVALSNDAPCEDIAMSFLVAHYQSPHILSALLPPSLLPSISSSKMFTPRPPILFKSNLTEIHSSLYSGLSQGIASTIWREKRHDCVQELVDIFGGKRPGDGESFYWRDPVRERIYRLPVEGHLEEGWCSDLKGSRVCRQP